MRKKYQFDLLIQNSNVLALESRRTFRHEIDAVKRGFYFLDHHFQAQQGKLKSPATNIKMVLTTRFMNHLFTTFLLAERGLVLDAMNGLRSATETIAFYWLVCVEPTSAYLFTAEESPRPVEIRKRLESIGIDVSDLKDAYNFQSTVTHIGNQYEKIQIAWDDDQSGKLQIGGGRAPKIQAALFTDIANAIPNFVKHDSDYVVSRTNNGALIEDR